ncbi:hypothetical protein EUX98_g3826 [Antrodiella citrinella]|uniref:Major facilitator superfamily (MFS) profile domain-containing protein n=1 Tax=Antrodiella citrinella TaxID=2447956 RepID=A0A4S4MYD5_9APHY|nr:hypothetical protein EUX98_g3826 [Antrodiella citrinella]
MVLPDGQINEETMELLQEFIHPHHEADETLAGEDDLNDEDEDFKQRAEARCKLPWYKRPSPVWFLASVGASAFAISATIAPRIELYTQLVCDIHKPNYTIGRGAEDYGMYSLYADTKERSRICAADPEVGAAVATLVMVYSAAMGVLGCLTTGWWTSLSDRVGRTNILGIGLLGVLYSDFNFISVATFSKYLPGTYWWFPLGALVEGMFGGPATLNAVVHAYVADIVEPHERARIFSLFYGLLFCGLAFGPTIGGLIVKFTGSPLSVFYLSTGVHTAYALGIWFIVPESLSAAQKRESRRAYEASVAKGKQDAIDSPILYRLKSIFGFLSPLSVLWSIPDGSNTSPNPLKSRKKDWSLILMALSYSFAILLMGSYSYKFQYTSKVFGWTSEQIGYWLSIVGVVRAVYLTLILPLVIKLFKPKPTPAVQLPATADEPLIRSRPSSPSPSRSPSRAPSRNPSHTPSITPQSTTQSIVFDLNLARVSVLIELIAFSALPMAMNPLVFTALSVVSCFGAGHAPAAQSVSLALYARRGGVESGKLLGAFGVLQVLSAQIMGPALFGMTYVKTISTMPGTIFYVSSAAVGISLILLLFVRIPEPFKDIEEREPQGARTPLLVHVQDETLVDPDADIPVIVVNAASPKVASSRDD